MVPSTVNSRLTSSVLEIATFTLYDASYRLQEREGEKDRGRERTREKIVVVHSSSKRICCSDLTAVLSNLYEESVINHRCPLFGDTEGGSLTEHTTVLISINLRSLAPKVLRHELVMPNVACWPNSALLSELKQYQRMSQDFHRQPPHTVLVFVSSGRKFFDRARTLICNVLALSSDPFLDDTVETWQCCFSSDRLTVAKSVRFLMRPLGLTFFTRDTVVAVRGRGGISSYPLKLQPRFVLLVVISTWYKDFVCLCPMGRLSSSESVTPRSLDIFVSLL